MQTKIRLLLSDFGLHFLAFHLHLKNLLDVNNVAQIITVNVLGFKIAQWIESDCIY